MGINSDLGLLGVLLTLIFVLIITPYWFIWVPLSYFTLTLPYHIYYMDIERSSKRQKPAFLFIPKWNIIVIFAVLLIQIATLLLLPEIWQQLEQIGLGRLMFAYVTIWISGGIGTIFLTIRLSENWDLERITQRFIYSLFGIGVFLLISALFAEFGTLDTDAGSIFFFNLFFFITAVLTGFEITYLRKADLISKASMFSIESNPNLYFEDALEE